MTIGERIRYLRKTLLALSQEEFSKKINISRSNLGNIEIKKIRVTDRVISDICREFAVNREWLAAGTGPVFAEGADPLAEEILRIYATLNEDNRKYLRGYMQRLLDEQKEDAPS